MGREIALAHSRRQLPYLIADVEQTLVEEFLNELVDAGVAASRHEPILDGLHTLSIGDDFTDRPKLMVESVIEDLSIKRSLFKRAAEAFGDDSLLCSNTSTLRLSEIANGLPNADRVCGMHFFMPVHARAAVEVVATPDTSRRTIDVVSRHVTRLGMRSIHCRDSAGFIVNRMLSPYLNQSLLLLAHGVSATRLDRCARAYGMPLSPLELIDWIGARTMYQAGRVYANAFPKRLDPSPIVPAMVKRKRFGKHVGSGLFDYDAHGNRSVDLSSDACEIVETYKLRELELSDGDVMLLLSIPMWIEACALLAEGVTDSLHTVDLAMVGGLGYSSDLRWSEFFEQIGAKEIDDAIERWSGTFRSMRPIDDA